MDQDKVDKLAEILKRLNKGDDLDVAKEEAAQFLASLDEAELPQVEEKLVASGLKPEDLRHLCSIHMDMLEGKIDKIKLDLKPGHLINTMICEHDEILGFLDELEKINQNTQKMENYGNKEEINKLGVIAKNLVDAESHHRREEEVLFKEMEERGVSGPPEMMRIEHEDLRRRKKELKELVEKAYELKFVDFKKKLDVISKFIIFNLRDHIFKENNILYPIALETIRDDDVWKKMDAECDKIGYCSFTPKKCL